jgi:hypothetical protein
MQVVPDAALFATGAHDQKLTMQREITPYFLVASRR